MKKQDLFKFSLTAICVAVLSACGSSGGGSLAVDNANTTTPSTNNNNAAAEKAAAEKAAAEKAAAEKAAAEKAAAEKAAAEKAAAAEAAAKQAAAEKAAAEKAAAEAAAKQAAAEKAAAEAAAKQAAAEKAAAAAKTAADKAAAEKAAAEAKAAAEKAAAEKAAKEAAAKAAAEQAAAVKKAAEEAAKKAADEAAKKAAIEQAAAVKKAAEEAAKKALEEKAAADKAAAEAKAAAEEAAKKAAEEAAKAAAANDATNPFGAKDQLAAEPDTAHETSFVGFKQTVKVNSNLATNKSVEKDSTSDIPTPMAVQKPQPSLDNIVVAEPKGDAGAARVYLEDFDTRLTQDVLEDPLATGFLGSENTVTGKDDINGIKGNRTLAKIYLNQNTTAQLGDPKIEREREKLQQALTKAKNELKAEKAKAVEIDAKSYPFADAGLDKEPETDKLKEIEEAINAVDNMTFEGIEYNSAGLPKDADNQAKASALKKVQYDALYAQKTKLEAELASSKQKVHALEPEVMKASAAFEKYNAEHKPVEDTEENRVSEKRDAKYGGLDYETKTETMGKEQGAIWTFAYEDIKAKHQNFTEKSSSMANPKYAVNKGFVYAGRNLDGSIIAKGYNVENLAYDNSQIGVADAPLTMKEGHQVQSRNLDNTVAEVYGYRSKAHNNENGIGFKNPLDTMDLSAQTNDPQEKVWIQANNLPLVNEYVGAKLANVQYGRVTSALSDRAASTEYLKEGLQLNQHGTTYVASFGLYGKDGTENHYFFRGINNVGATELTQLKKDEKNGIITYDGHAVTYGLDNNYRGNIPIPTALGARTGFVSGNHVSAAVDLANGDVTAKIYNKWYDSYNSPKDLVQVPLVNLKGKLADNGNIAGTATRIDNGTSGLFGATLYGKGAEMGGIFASEANGKDKWGGSFGAIRVPATEEAKEAAGMAVGTDKRN